MKFRDPKTGAVFDDIRSEQVRFMCPGPCNVCPLGPDRCTEEWCNKHPLEAAYLMGYEVVEDHIGEATETEEKPMKKMDKPLSDWTVGEAQQYCKETQDAGHCKDGCRLRKMCDAMECGPYVPGDWVLEET